MGEASTCQLQLLTSVPYSAKARQRPKPLDECLASLSALWRTASRSLKSKGETSGSPTETAGVTAGWRPTCSSGGGGGVLFEAGLGQAS